MSASATQGGYKSNKWTAGFMDSCTPEYFRAKLPRIRSFVRYCGQGSSPLWTPVRRPSVGPMRLPGERGGESVGVCECVRDVHGRKAKEA